MRIAVVALLAILLPAAVLAEETVKKPHVPLAKTIGEVGHKAPVPSLAVLNAKGARLEGTTLTLIGVSPNSIMFADRPVRAAGHVPTAKFIGQWGEGRNSFAKNPPNATISVLSADGTDVADAVVVLKMPKMAGDDLTFEVAVLEGNLDGATGAAALFIDHFGSYYGVDSVNGGDPTGNYAWVDPRIGGAWYSGGAGDGGGNPYYLPKCGYYPDPPCY